MTGTATLNNIGTCQIATGSTTESTVAHSSLCAAVVEMSIRVQLLVFQLLGQCLHAPPHRPHRINGD